MEAQQCFKIEVCYGFDLEECFRLKFDGGDRKYKKQIKHVWHCWRSKAENLLAVSELRILSIVSFQSSKGNRWFFIVISAFSATGSGDSLEKEFFLAPKNIWEIKNKNGTRMSRRQNIQHHYNKDYENEKLLLHNSLILPQVLSIYLSCSITIMMTKKGENSSLFTILESIQPLRLWKGKSYGKKLLDANQNDGLWTYYGNQLEVFLWFVYGKKLLDAYQKMQPRLIYDEEKNGLGNTKAGITKMPRKLLVGLGVHNMNFEAEVEINFWAHHNSRRLITRNAQGYKVS